MSARAFRLPTHVRPLSYHIDLSTDPSRTEFSGSVTIELEIASPTETILLHARHLEVTRADVSAMFGDTVSALWTYQPDQETITLLLDKPLPVGRARVMLVFSGRLAPSMHGLYLGADGVHSAVCSQCEATDARAIFPCFDEPAFKAALRWTLRTGPGVIALSNGVLSQHSEAEGEQVFEFAETKPVSSYLAAVVVGDFESEPADYVRDVPLKVYAPSGKGRQTHFAKDFTSRILPWFEQYFDFPYPFGKYDQVAVPGFDAGAMENIGLVLFRQNLLLMEPGTASWRQEKIIALVIAHEMAHMWFGNVVTMQWWDDLWLNEAFAEWMAHKACHAINPSYEVWNDFIEDKSRVLFDDAMHSTHSIWTPVETPDEAIEMFDSITYQKGCAVMRMLENFLGEEAFRDGLRSYMRQFQYGNACGPDLWRALEVASSQPVSALMKTWVAQPGYPVVDIALHEEGGVWSLDLRQERFFSDGNSQPSDQLWSIPMTVRYSDDEGVKAHRFIFSDRTMRLELPSKGAVRWVYGNQDEIGFYRQRFSKETLAKVLSEVTTVLSPVEQVGLLEDQWAMVRNGSASITSFLAVLSASAASQTHNVLRVVAERLDALDLIVKDAGDHDARRTLRGLAERWFLPQLQSLGFAPLPGESQNDTQRRAICISTLAQMARVASVISTSEQFAAAEQANPRAVDPNLAGTFVAIAAKFGDEARYDRWVETFQARKAADKSPQEVARYLHTLSQFRRPELTERTLNLIAQGVIPQEAVAAILGQLLSLRHSQQAAWTFLKQNWSSLRERFGDMGVSRVVDALGRLKGSSRNDVVSFFEQHKPAGAERALLRALERIDQAEQLRRSVTPELLAHLQAQKP
ncbi:MAG: M1 family metallopeptidase [Polyangia bacterium]|jgi:puromycin-sensitive aminopeptidase